MNKVFAFISRHIPTPEQHALASEQGITLDHIGDADAFTVTPDFVTSKSACDGVVVVHPAAAMRLSSVFPIGVFENATRPAPDGRPQFYAKAFHIYDTRG
jgi:hypothetical protein